MLVFNDVRIASQSGQTLAFYMLVFVRKYIIWAVSCEHRRLRLYIS